MIEYQQLSGAVIMIHSNSECGLVAAYRWSCSPSQLARYKGLQLWTRWILAMAVHYDSTINTVIIKCQTRANTGYYAPLDNWYAGVNKTCRMDNLLATVSMAEAINQLHRDWQRRCIITLYDEGKHYPMVKSYKSMIPCLQLSNT